MLVTDRGRVDSAAVAAQRIGGVSGVTNFLLLPERGFERLRPGLR